MAPEETSTISAPGTFSTIASTSASTRLPSSPPAVVVSDEDPILTTVLGDPAMSGRPGFSGLGLSGLAS